MLCIFTNVSMYFFSAKVMSAIDILVQSEEEFFFKAFLDFIKKRCVTLMLKTTLQFHINVSMFLDTRKS